MAETGTKETEAKGTRKDDTTKGEGTMTKTDKTGTKGTKVTGKKDNTTKGEKAMTTEAKTKNNGNHKRVVKLADMPTIKLTKAAFNKLTPETLVAQLVDPDNADINRIGRERALALLVDRIENDRIKINEPAILMYLTFNSVRVAGVKTTSGFSEKNAKVKLTKAEFKALTAKQKADYVAKYCHKRRVADRILPAYIAAGMPMTAEDVVYVTCGRVAVAGVTVTTASKKLPVPTNGVQFD